MSNIEIGNIKKNLKQRNFNILKMSQKNYVGTYYFNLRQTINYDRKKDGRLSNKYILIISNPEGTYIDYLKGTKKDINKVDFGKRCVFKKGETIVTGVGSDPSSVLLNIKTKALLTIILKVLIYICIAYFLYENIIIKFL